MQTDPIGYTSDLDLYAYVGNDPIDRMDPTGTQVVPAIIACGADPLCAAAAAATGAYVGTKVVQAGSIIRDHFVHNESAPSDAPTVNPDKQGKHQPGHPNFQPGKSELDHSDPQGLVDKGAGTGQQVGDKPVGEPGSKERVDFGEPIGAHVNPKTGERSPTNVGIIHYGKKDVHNRPGSAKPAENHHMLR